MPFDLIFYGLMALTFIGIIGASAAARRARRHKDTPGGKSEGADTPRHS